MRPTPILRLLPVAVFLCACSDEPAYRFGPGELDHASLSPTRLASQVVAQGDFLARPSQVTVVGDRLLVLDGLGDAPLHVVSGTGDYLHSLGGRGAGPGEYKGAWSVAPDPRSPDHVWVFDFSLGRLTRVGLEPPEAQPREPEMITLHGDAVALKPIWAGDSLLVSATLSPAGRLTFFGRDGAFRRTAGAPPTDEKGSPPEILQQAWMGHLVSRPDGSRLVMASQYGDRIEFFQADGTPIRTVRGPFRFDPRFKVANHSGQPVMEQGDDMRWAYVEAIPTPERLYLVFSGRTREAYKGGSSFGRFVHVYDWNGELVQVLELDEAILGAAISPDGRWLYGIRHDPLPAILRFPLEGVGDAA